MDPIAINNKVLNIVLRAHADILQYYAYKLELNTVEELTAIYALRDISKGIISTLEDIQSLLDGGHNVTLLQTEDFDIDQRFRSILGCCYETFSVLRRGMSKLLLVISEQDFNQAGKSRELWDDADIGLVVENLKDISTGLKLLIQAFNL
jgi:hypothetical protein